MAVGVAHAAVQRSQLNGLAKFAVGIGGPAHLGVRGSEILVGVGVVGPVMHGLLEEGDGFVVALLAWCATGPDR